MAKGQGAWSAGTPDPKNSAAAKNEQQCKAMRQDAGAAAGRGKRAV